MTTTPEGKALHDLYREFTETLRYDPSDPDLFERLVSDPRYSRTHSDDIDAAYEDGERAGYDHGYDAALSEAAARLHDAGFYDAAEVLP